MPEDVALNLTITSAASSCFCPDSPSIQSLFLLSIMHHCIVFQLKDEEKEILLFPFFCVNSKLLENQHAILAETQFNT